jgi:hypothetical protein
MGLSRDIFIFKSTSSSVATVAILGSIHLRGTASESYQARDFDKAVE